MLTFISPSISIKRLGLALGVFLVFLGAAEARALETCVECHNVPGIAVGEKSLWIHQEEYEASLHGRLSCSDCHKKVGSFPHLPEMEVRCDLPCHARELTHAVIWETDAGGVHSRKDRPSCIGCHDGGPARRKPDSGPLCRGCHENLEPAAAIYPSTPGDLARRGHGRAAAENRAPDCDSCHGHHGVEESESARSSCMKEGCHPNENPKFGLFFTHAAQTPPKPWGGVKLLFLGLLGLLAVVFLAHSLRYEEPATPEGVKTPQKVEVLDQIDLMLHFFAMAAVVMALATGPFLQFPGLSSVDPSSFGFAHGAAGITALLVWVFHFSRVTIEWLEGRNPWGLLPGTSDAKAMFRGVAGGFGAGAPPERGRFNYRERFSYAAFVLAAPVMVFTGYVVGHPSRFSGLLGPSGVMGSATLHSALGLLILLPLIWHLYFALLQPGNLWFNGSFITGKIPFERALRVRPDWARGIIEEITAGLEPPKETEEEEVTVESLLEKGNEAAREGQYKVACYHFLKALELYPGYSQALYNLGVVLYKSGDFKRSAIVLEKFLTQDPFGPASGKARELIGEMKKKGGAQ